MVGHNLELHASAAGQPDFCVTALGSTVIATAIEVSCMAALGHTISTSAIKSFTSARRIQTHQTTVVIQCSMSNHISCCYSQACVANAVFTKSTRGPRLETVLGCWRHSWLSYSRCPNLRSWILIYGLIYALQSGTWSQI